MRKILTTIAIVLCAISVKSQDFKIDETTKLITYTEVVELPNVSKADLYLRANTWFSRAFKSAKNVIDFQDKETGKIIAKGSIGTSIKMPLSPRVESGNISFSMTIICKDGKYKYMLDNLNHSAPLTTGTGTWISIGSLEQEKAKAGLMNRPSIYEWRELKVDADIKIKELLLDLKKNMAKSESEF